MSDINETQQPAPEGSILDQIGRAAGGSATRHTITDGDGNVVHTFGIISLPLPKDHWIYQEDETVAGPTNVPPMPLRMGANSRIYLGYDKENIGDLIKSGPQKVPAVKLDREQMAHAIRAAGRYAVRCSTMNGSEMDFDPDAMLQNLVVGFLGYWTKDGLIGDPGDAAWCDPQKPFDFGTPEPPAKWCDCTETQPCAQHANPTSAPPAHP